ncbi:helix-turn-helix domain-containing protein [Marinococcus luteus]|uniref:helix-turn-helix domain-containing protein n=1 Tax=Marinococcus luteus TaxID=1122204 RepID=UPI002ACCD4D9|nr:helix-turn-helix transcriptional regulator [Marinococcus luteus]MDZ5782073.1 helix-turn-helix transcriptional regulator [Marinococcus luteus]
MNLNVGGRAKEIRISKGIKQKFIAEAIGYKNAASYADIEAGRRKLDANKIPDLAKALNVNVEDLFFINKNRETRINHLMKETKSH